MEEAKEQVRFFSSSRRREGDETLEPRKASPSASFHDPPPPYTPSQERLNELSPPPPQFSPSGAGASAPQNSTESLSGPCPETGGFYPLLPSSSDGAVADASVRRREQWTSPPRASLESEADGAETRPGRKNRMPFGSRKRITKTSEARLKSAPDPIPSDSVTEESSLSSSSSSSFYSTPSSTPPFFASSSVSPPPMNGVHPNFSPPPPYNPFYEWSEFPPKK